MSKLNLKKQRSVIRTKMNFYKLFLALALCIVFTATTQASQERTNISDEFVENHATEIFDKIQRSDTVRMAKLKALFHSARRNVCYGLIKHEMMYRPKDFVSFPEAYEKAFVQCLKGELFFEPLYKAKKKAMLAHSTEEILAKMGEADTLKNPAPQNGASK